MIAVVKGSQVLKAQVQHARSGRNASLKQMQAKKKDNKNASRNKNAAMQSQKEQPVA